MERRNSAIARIFAALAIVAAVLVVLVVVSSSDVGETSKRSGNGKSRTAKQRQPSKKRTKAKTYVVRSGDTLTSIAHKTGIPVAELLALNPEVDPQILIAGQSLKLR